MLLNWISDGKYFISLCLLLQCGSSKGREFFLAYPEQGTVESWTSRRLPRETWLAKNGLGFDTSWRFSGRIGDTTLSRQRRLADFSDARWPAVVPDVRNSWHLGVINPGEAEPRELNSIRSDEGAAGKIREWHFDCRSCVHWIGNPWSLRGVDFRRLFGRGWQRFGAPVRTVSGCEHDKLMEFSSTSFFIGSFIRPIADVREDEEDWYNEDRRDSRSKWGPVGCTPIIPNFRAPKFRKIEAPKIPTGLPKFRIFAEQKKPLVGSRRGIMKMFFFQFNIPKLPVY